MSKIYLERHWEPKTIIAQCNIASCKVHFKTLGYRGTVFGVTCILALPRETLRLLIAPSLFPMRQYPFS